MELLCVNCGMEIQRLLVQYSPGNIRLMKCQNCGAVADPYLECEFMILLIDLILHKEKAYRHLLFNLLSQNSTLREGILWKSSLIYIISDIYRTFLLSDKLESSKISDFSAFFGGKVLSEVFFGNISFFGFLVLARMFFPGQRSSWFLVVLLSSYFKTFLALMMVWEFPSSAIYIIDVLVISSNFVALKVLKKMSSSSCFGVILGAHGVKFLISACLGILYSSLLC